MMKKRSIRQSVVVSAALLLALFLLPLAVIAPFRSALFGLETPVDETEGAPFVSGDLDAQTHLKVLNGDTVEEMDLGAYLVGVVRAEMPASFEIEALKAQAVAARTYTLYKMRSGGNHGDSADICTDSTCCQAYLAEDRALENWGKSGRKNEEKIETAVKETDGQAILYAGAPILAVFHSCSAGLTRAAGEVWVNDLPYLQAVTSPEPEDSIPNYFSRVEFTAEEFKTKVLAACEGADLSGGVAGWLKDAVTDSAGSVEKVTVGGVTVKGGTLRSILGLRSACFEWEVQDGKLVFYVTGYGHGVGMSQYGANEMAAEGADYLEILTHYYTGVTVGPYRQG
ncbi:stage II sporulation protein D [Oscillibacter sp.]|uniref:stage II sporulation protein D n=1 Tax=Oscillibacter sp. TaxID=1945593 RepID=UPI00262C292F|nr:stage II sporulation protein D [Oscillibacter sp.]MDD3347448.1 stage II sporulation protein D [Oscillibacter sp.]